MGVRAYTEARAAANKKYDDATYKNVLIRLRIEDDKDILEDIEEAQKRGMRLRDWLREVWEKS